MSIRGSCLCGDVTYQVEGPYVTHWHCHCSQCRKAHGAAFASYAEFEPGNFRWLSGEDLVTTYQLDDGGYCFCRQCGSSLATCWKGEMVQVSYGTMDDNPGVYPDRHIFVGSKACWDDIRDSLPQHDEWPPGSVYADA